MESLNVKNNRVEEFDLIKGLAIIMMVWGHVGIPGIKLGLANIVILITLYELGIKEAILVNALRVVLVSLITGTLLSYGFLMSLTGAILSLGVMILFHTLIKKFSIIGVSVLGALFHIIGQIIVAMIFLESIYVLYYLPLIAVTSIITGVLVGLGSQLIIKTGAIKKEQLESMMNQIFTDLLNELPSKKEVDEVFNYLDKNKF